MDYLEEPGGRQRAMSVASILTNTMEGQDQAFVILALFCSHLEPHVIYKSGESQTAEINSPAFTLHHKMCKGASLFFSRA